MKVNLNNKIAVITGGSGYLCSEMARVLAGNGAKVVIVSRRKEKLQRVVDEITSKGQWAMGISADVTKKLAIERVRNEICERWGTCDILINGAGGNKTEATSLQEFYDPTSSKSGRTKGFFDMDINALEENMRLNFYSAILCSQVFGIDMVRNGSGNIVNLSSMASLTTITRVPAYSAAKAAIDNFTKWLAVYLGKTGVRVNAIAPGFFLGEQNKHLLVNQDGSYTARGEKIIRNTPYERFGEADELNSTLLYLLADESKFVTGLIVAVDGGFSIFSGV